jgi:hypothetical protein
MFRTELVYFKRIPGLSDIHYEDLHKAIVQSNLERDANEGFINTERTANSISAVLAVQRQALHTMLVDGRLVEHTIVYYQQIPFTVDFRYSTVEVLAGAQKANKVASVIGKISYFRYPIEDLFFSPMEVYWEMFRAGYSLEITQLFITNFNPTEGVSGRFSPKITQTPKGLALLEKYDRNVTDVIYEVKSPEQVEFALRVSSAGGLAIRVESEKVDLVLEALKKLILPERRTHV